ncbi:MAG TPA: SH3 domain-containing protein [Rhodocyclaceae bacterium]|nr:SH3 domain-containing protein [Rhodocyclaceae bacterium]
MRKAALPWLAWLAAFPAAALEYRSVVEPALLYDSPSQQGKPLYAIARGTPVEAIVVLDTWVKVRDSKGDLAWIEKRMLSDKRTLMVRADRAQVREQPEDSAALVFEAERDVLLEYVEPGPAGWIKVRHRDGQQGFVKAAQVWGN